MLHISRKVGEGITLGDSVEIEVLEVRGKTVKLGLRSPKDMPILRREIRDSILAENQAAAQADMTALQGVLGGLYPKKES